MKYVDTDKLVKSINNYQEGAKAALNPTDGDADYYKGKIDACKDIQEFIATLQQEQPDVDLEGEATKFVQSKEFIESKESPVLLTARYFYELGVNARKRAADMDDAGKKNKKRYKGNGRLIQAGYLHR